MEKQSITWDCWLNRLKEIEDYLNVSHTVRADVKITVENRDGEIVISAPIEGKEVKKGCYKRFATFDRLTEKLFNNQIEISDNYEFPYDENCPNIYAFLLGEDSEEYGYLESSDVLKSLVIHTNCTDYIKDKRLLEIITNSNE